MANEALPAFMRNLRSLAFDDVANEKKPVGAQLENVWSWLTFLKRGDSVRMTAAHVDFYNGQAVHDVSAALLRRRTLGGAGAPALPPAEVQAAVAWVEGALRVVAAHMRISAPDVERLLPLLANADAALFRAFDAPPTRAQVEGWVDALAAAGTGTAAAAAAAASASAGGLVRWAPGQPLPRGAVAAPEPPPAEFFEGCWADRLRVGDAVDQYVPELRAWVRAVVDEVVEGGEFKEKKLRRPALARFLAPPEPGGAESMDTDGEPRREPKSWEVQWLSVETEVARLAQPGTRAPVPDAG
jgi:hypothetical protein